MSNRLFKQMVATFFTTSIVLAIGFGIFKTFLFKPVVYDPRLAEIQQLNPLEYEEGAFWVRQGNRLFIYARALNPNEKWGAKKFKYSFDLIVASEEANIVNRTLLGESYILPRQTKYVVAVLDDANIQFNSVKFNIEKNSLDWEEVLDEEYLNPNLFSITNIDINTGTGQISTPTQVQSTVFYEFKKDLKRGDTGEDVFNLQSVLAKDSSVYPEGVVNGTFDLATYKAVIRFQNVAGISPQTGIVDFKTRDILNKMFAGSKTETISQGGFSFDSNLKFGDMGSEVRELQRVLSADPSVYPEARLNGNFDYLLKRALERFQDKYSLSKTGEFDTPTRTKLNSILNVSTNVNKLSPGLTAEVAFTIFNNSSSSFNDVSLIGFLCNSQNSVVAVSGSIIKLDSQKNQNVSFSWEHSLPDNISVCPGGLQAYTNVFDKNNIIK